MAKQYKTANQHYLKLYDGLIESPAYRDLKPAARALLIEFAYLYRPKRNGFLSISTRNAARTLNVTEPVASQAFYDLASHGFIKLKNHESWQERKAREWILTWEPCSNKEPTNDWKHWVKGVDLCPFKPHNRKKTRPPKTGAVLPMKSRAACL